MRSATPRPIIQNLLRRLETLTNGNGARETRPPMFIKPSAQTVPAVRTFSEPVCAAVYPFIFFCVCDHLAFSVLILLPVIKVSLIYCLNAFIVIRLCLNFDWNTCFSLLNSFHVCLCIRQFRSTIYSHNIG